MYFIKQIKNIFNNSILLSLELDGVDWDTSQDNKLDKKWKDKQNLKEIKLDGKLSKEEISKVKEFVEEEKLQILLETQNKFKDFIDSDYRYANENYLSKNGKTVKSLQGALNKYFGRNPGDEGYLETDNFYGKSTFLTLMEFQKKEGLIVDSLAGPNTQEKLSKYFPVNGNDILGEKNDSLPKKTKKKKQRRNRSWFEWKEGDMVAGSNSGTEMKEYTTLEFVKKAKYISFKIQEKYGIPWQVVLGQSLLESGNGQSKLTKVGNNAFGHKAIGNQPSIGMITGEYRGGKYGKELAKFRTFGNIEQSFEAYAKLLTRASRYRGAFMYKNNPEKFLYEIISSGYATLAPSKYVKYVKARLKRFGEKLA